MSSPYVTALIPQIRGYLTSSDLGSISAKRIRKQLVESGHDASTIKDHRKAIDAEIEKIYLELTDGSPPPPATPSSSFPINPPSSLPRALSIKKEIKPQIKHSPPPTLDRKPHTSTAAAETDEQMALRLQREFDNQGSSTGGGRASRSTANGVAPKKKKSRVKRKAVDGSGDEGTPKKKRAGGGNGAFNKELILSDALSDLVGVSRLSRPQVVKQIWEYVKARDLQDPSDKRYIRCDEPLKRVFHTDRLHMFTMNKILVAHVMNPEEVAGAGEGGADRKPAAVASSQGSGTGGIGRGVKAERKPVLSQAEIISSDEDESDDEY